MNKKEKLEKLYDKWKDCRRCTLCKRRIELDQYIVPGYGNLDAAIMAIGSKVSGYESDAGMPMQGPVGKLYDTLLEGAGLHRDMIWTTNLTVCRIDADRPKDVWIVPDPKKAQIAQCQPRLLQEIAIIQPKVIMLMGTLPIEYFLNRVPLRKRWVERYAGPFRLYCSMNPAAAKEGRGRTESRFAEMASHWREVAEWTKENEDGGKYHDSETDH